jgi:hypothetical protein
MQDAAWKLYISAIASRRRNRGLVSKHSIGTAVNGIRNFLTFLGRDITTTAISDLIRETRELHRNDDFTIDNALLSFVATPPIITHSNYGAFIKGMFKVNRAPLQASFNTCFAKSTRKISLGILKALYDILPEEHKAIMDWQAYAGERIACMSRNITTKQIEIVNEKYAIVHIEAGQTKARKPHICIIPRTVTDRVLEIARQTGRMGSAPFPNAETIWREITEIALEKFGLRLTSHYLRKRFHTIAGKTPMPVNSWDYLMGAAQSLGHNASIYTLEDFSDLISEYDRFLAPYLSIGNPKEPDSPRDPTQNADLAAQLAAANKKISELTEQVIKLTQLLTQKLTTTRT